MKHLLVGAALTVCCWGAAEAAPRPGGGKGGASLSSARIGGGGAALSGRIGTPPGRTALSLTGTKTTFSSTKTTAKIGGGGTAGLARLSTGPKGATAARLATASFARTRVSGLTLTRGVTARLPGNVRALGLGPVRGGARALPLWLRGAHRGRFICDLGRGRFLICGPIWGGCAVGLFDPAFAGGCLPVGTPGLPTVPGGGVGPVDPTDPGSGPVDPGADPGPESSVDAGTGDAPDVPAGANVAEMRMLKVTNNTNSNVKVFVQADNSKKPLEYNFKPGESNHLNVGTNQRLAANKVRIWAQSSSRSWTANRNTPLDLNRAPNKSNNVGTVNWVIR